MKRILLLALVGLVAVAVAGAATFAYVVTRPPALIDLKVTDGSIAGTIAGNFTNITNTQDALVLNFNATTFANQTDGNGSVLRMHLFTWTYYDPVAGAVFLHVDLTLAGSFASNLNPSSLDLTVNETGPIELDSHYAPATTNLSFDSQPVLALTQNGTGTLSATLTNQSRSASVYNFGFHPVFEGGGMFLVVWRPWYNHFLGFRATVNGPFTPGIRVSVLLEIVNTNGGTWT